MRVKTPETDAAFWITLLGACAMGETGGDLLSHGLKWGYVVSSLVLGVLFVAAMAWEFLSEDFSPLRYWTAIVATATVGTTVADLCSRTLALGYARTSFGLAVLLVIVLAIGRRLGGKKGEAAYWTAIAIISTIGTTLGDFTANDSGLGFGGASVVLGLALLVVLAVRATIRWTPLFWIAVLLTSTFGAASGDWLTKDEGLRLGPFWGTLALAAVLAIVVALTRRTSPAPRLT